MGKPLDQRKAVDVTQLIKVTIYDDNLTVMASVYVCDNTTHDRIEFMDWGYVCYFIPWTKDIDYES